MSNAVRQILPLAGPTNRPGASLSTRNIIATDTEEGMTAASPVPPPDLYITSELHRRAPRVTDHLGEKLALQDVAQQMLDQPEQVLPRLVEQAMRMTGAASGGISAFEPGTLADGIFHWREEGLAVEFGLPSTQLAN
jgi:hypothetical protein